jgi:hypothetical protein
MEKVRRRHETDRLLSRDYPLFAEAKTEESIILVLARNGHAHEVHAHQVHAHEMHAYEMHA